MPNICAASRMLTASFSVSFKVVMHAHYRASEHRGSPHKMKNHRRFLTVNSVVLFALFW
jgi:hypothetical protein